MPIVVGVILGISCFFFFAYLDNAYHYRNKIPAHLRLQLRNYWKITAVSGFTMVASIGVMIAMYLGVIGGWFS